MANIVICADGTWNRPEEDLADDHPTNVLKVARAINPQVSGTNQHVFYDWGVGSYYSALAGGVTGKGIHKNIVDAYRYIVQNYHANDKIYLFGFSRGAYTVRALCGLIYNCGIVKRADARLIEQAWRIYKSPSDTNHPDGDEAKSFRNDYSHKSRKVHFVGAWDTVGKLGIPFSLMGLLDSNDEFYDTKMGPNVAFARHAMAIDEQRKDFEPTLWLPRTGVNLEQVWFAGVHSDIGGSYAPDIPGGPCASDVSLNWMLVEAKAAGLKFETHIGDGLSDGSLSRLHKSRNHVYRSKKPLHRPLIDLKRPSVIHPSVKLRYLADESYRPQKLKPLVDSLGWDSISVGV
ncbi:MAG: DUF2235 domain-containing protein [Pseudomonadales bacterium]